MGSIWITGLHSVGRAERSHRMAKWLVPLPPTQWDKSRIPQWLHMGRNAGPVGSGIKKPFVSNVVGENKPSGRTSSSLCWGEKIKGRCPICKPIPLLLLLLALRLANGGRWLLRLYACSPGISNIGKVPYKFLCPLNQNALPLWAHKMALATHTTQHTYVRNQNNLEDTSWGGRGQREKGENLEYHHKYAVEQ